VASTYIEDEASAEDGATAEGANKMEGGAEGGGVSRDVGCQGEVKGGEEGDAGGGAGGDIGIRAKRGSSGEVCDPWFYCLLSVV
jgi:hypothetical protein